MKLLRSHDPLKLVLTVHMPSGGGSGNKLDWTLQQPAATKLKAEMKTLLFTLCDNLHDTMSKLQGDVWVHKYLGYVLIRILGSI